MTIDEIMSLVKGDQQLIFDDVNNKICLTAIVKWIYWCKFRFEFVPVTLEIDGLLFS